MKSTIRSFTRGSLVLLGFFVFLLSLSAQDLTPNALAMDTLAMYSG